MKIKDSQQKNLFSFSIFFGCSSSNYLMMDDDVMISSLFWWHWPTVHTHIFIEFNHSIKITRKRVSVYDATRHQIKQIKIYMASSWMALYNKWMNRNWKKKQIQFIKLVWLLLVDGWGWYTFCICVHYVLKPGFSLSLSHPTVFVFKCDLWSVSFNFVSYFFLFVCLSII